MSSNPADHRSPGLSPLESNWFDHGFRCGFIEGMREALAPQAVPKPTNPDPRIHFSRLGRETFCGLLYDRPLGVSAADLWELVTCHDCLDARAKGASGNG